MSYYVIVKKNSAAKFKIIKLRLLSGYCDINTRLLIDAAQLIMFNMSYSLMNDT